MMKIAARLPYASAETWPGALPIARSNAAAALAHSPLSKYRSPSRRSSSTAAAAGRGASAVAAARQSAVAKHSALMYDLARSSAAAPPDRLGSLDPPHDHRDVV